MNDHPHHDAEIEADLKVYAGHQSRVEIIRDGGDWPDDMRATEALIARAVDIAVALAKSADLLAPDIALSTPDPHINIVLSTDKAVRRLNREFRGMDQPTNVLSFPIGDDSAFAPVTDSVIGDVIIAFETVAAEARARRMPVDHHLIHLAVHGALHLLGLDHQDETEARNMEEIETKVLSGINISDPHQISARSNQSSRAASGE